MNLYQDKKKSNTRNTLQLVQHYKALNYEYNIISSTIFSYKHQIAVRECDIFYLLKT